MFRFSLVTMAATPAPTVTFDKATVAREDIRFLKCPHASDTTLQLLGVPTQYAEFIRCIDKFDDLELYHFVSTTALQQADVDTIRRVTDVKGTIVNTLTGRIVCRSLPYIPEIPADDNVKFLDIPGESIRYTFAREGTLLRVFWYGDLDHGEWFVSTNRRINGRTGRWGGIPFGEAFDATFGSDFSSLDKDYVYSMVVSHPANRLIYPQELDVKIVSVWHRPSGRHVPYTNAAHRQETFIASDINELLRVIDTTPADYAHAGVIVTDPTGRWPVKIVKRDYLRLRAARGTEPSIRARYLHLRFPEPMELDGDTEGSIVGRIGADDLVGDAVDADNTTNPSAALLDVLYWLYANALEPTESNNVHTQLFAEIEQEISKMVKWLHSLYINRYIRKQIVELPKEDFVAIQNLHNWHCADRSNNIVTRRVVEDHVNATPYFYLVPILNRLRKPTVTTPEVAPSVAEQAVVDTPPITAE